MLKSILKSIHGVGDKYVSKDNGIRKVSEVAFGLIPHEENYDADELSLKEFLCV